MVATEPKAVFSRNIPLLRVVQALAILLVLAIRWPSLREAVTNVEPTNLALFKELSVILVSMALAVIFISISFIFLHGKLMGSPWGDGKSSNRWSIIFELGAILLAVSLCGLAWPTLARSSYFGYQQFLREVAGFGEKIGLAIILVMALFGGGYALHVYRKMHAKRADNG